MTFSQKNDVRNHLMRPQKKRHYLTPTEPQPTAEKSETGSVENAAPSTTQHVGNEPILVTKK